MRHRSKLIAVLFAFVAYFAMGATSAWAQSYYTVQQLTVGSRWVTPPASGTTQIYGSGVDSGTNQVTPPFNIPFWGTGYSSVRVSSDGYMHFGSAAYSSYIWSGLQLPIASGATNDGHVAVCNYDLYSGNSNGRCIWWVDGTAPNRRFIVAWLNWDTYPNASGNMNFQAQFGENGLIVFSYTGSSFTSASYQVGMDRPGDSTQFIRPTTTVNSTVAFTTPNYDYQFSALQITGRVLFDRYVTTAAGIGTNVEYGIPLSGMTVVQLDANGGSLGVGITDAAGNFTVYGSPVANGSLAVLSATTAGAVRKVASGALYQAKFLTNYDFTQPSPIAVGTLTLGEPQDPGGVNRAPINIARSMQTLYDWTKLRFPSKTIQQVDPVLWDTASAAATSYTQKNGATLASMRVSSAASGNPDEWDTSVLNKVYGRHILGAIAADPGGAYDPAFETPTNDTNAFAEGFGYYMNAIVTRDTKYFDGINSSTTNILDLENPTLPVKAPNVAGCVAAALYDLVDGVTVEEPWDLFDGSTSAGEQAFLAVGSMTVPVTSTNFFTAWINRGYDATALARNFIHHGVLVDDGDEPNDYGTEATALTQFGFIRTNRVLNRFNDDWYRFTLAYPTNVLTVDCVYDRTLYSTAQVLLELQSTSGAVLATGTPVGVTGPIEAKSGAIPAGDYFVRVKLLGGGPIANYTLQAFSQLAFISGSFQPWTVGRPINVPVNMTGGIPPYDLAVLSPFVKPDGLVLDGVNARVAGTPTGPQTNPIPVGGSYTYDFILSARDSAAPTANIASGPVSFTVNDALREHFAPFIAFPFAKPVDVAAPFTGGTPPYVVSIDEGALPSGLQATGGSGLRIAGTPDLPGSYAFKITGTDVAGSADTAEVVGVACVPIGQAALAAGDSACGFYFDVVKGSSVSITVTTVRIPGRVRTPPRELYATMFDKDGSTVLIQPKERATRGRVTSGVFTAPSTGRFYFVVSSDDDGAQATLQAKARIIANKGGKGDSGPNSFVAPNTFPVEVGALAGATLTFSAKPSRGSGLGLRGAYLLDPAGNLILFAEGEVVERPDGSMTFRRILPISGTWSVVVGAKPGPQGSFTYTYSLREPPKAVYSAD
jgi:hypothetical protein